MMKNSVFFLAALLVCVGSVFSACSSDGTQTEENGGTVLVDMVLESPEIAHEGTIPDKYACTGDDLSPPIGWSNVPAGTVSFLLVMDDPEAPSGTFTHWVIYNIPAEFNGLAEGLATLGELENGILQASNDFGEVGYGGPCPPIGQTHTYFFTVYALDATIDLPGGTKYSHVTDAMGNHILGTAILTASFGR